MAHTMLFEWRTYRFAPGRATAYLDVFAREGLAVVTRHLPMVGYWLTECGRLNTLHHLWVYGDLDDRAACRAALASDPDWTEGFGPRAFPMIERQDTLFLALHATSPRLDGAVRTARAPRTAVATGQPVLATSLAVLEKTDVAERDACGAPAVGVWKISVGRRAGRALALLTGADDALVVPERPIRRELMRPCAFSPLEHQDFSDL